MDSVSFEHQRETLQESIAHDAKDLYQAVQELTDAARLRFDLGAHIKGSPFMWLLGGFLFGVWLGSRRNHVPISLKSQRD